jgi:hypothetical protein
MVVEKILVLVMYLLCGMTNKRYICIELLFALSRGARTKGK